ncbi:beta/gamma crystallin domain-containing protein [Nonomuraea rubra]|uniref:Streptomyces killer toxin-like beta/gamma crystallin domain-containing protein n=1 Tax=Nonomuraea rubra TaxID=46180 RepID=A0A7X0TXG2_9ACTN|nr:beta/gamma crystallin domain-containing protein [Nonomuraea rubra]MBB6547200.1 hypothetical protein [Nonomuraea rubra]
MKNSLRKVVATGAVALAAVVTVPAGPAYAINGVACRNNPLVDEFLYVNGHCFANGGTMGVAIYGVETIWSGNNRVAITYIDDLGGPSGGMLLDKWRMWDFSDDGHDRIHKVTSISIY